MTVEQYIDGVAKGDRVTLSKAITLIESNAPKDFDKAQRVLQGLLPKTGKALRIGITGVPGAGKSTFIESFGQMLCHQGYKVAVLAVDPTSSITGGSILGDKTRMQNLSREPNCFIRPSPSKGTLGGAVSMLDEVGRQSDPRIICIGPVTERAAKAAGLAVHQSAVVYTAEGIKDVLLYDKRVVK